MTNDDDAEPRVPEVTRRAAMSTPAKAAVGGAGVLGILGLSTDSASAQQSVEPAQVLRDSQDREIRLRMLDGDYLLEHVPSGATFSYDQSEGYWTLNTALDLGGNDVQNVGSLGVDDLSVENVGARVYPTTDQTVPDATVTTVAFDTSGFEDGNVTVDYNNNNVTIDSAGLYLLIASVRFITDSGWSTGDSINAYIFVNGSSEFISNNRKVGTANESVFMPPSALPLSQGDVVDMRVFHNSGGDRDISGDGSYTMLNVVRIG